MCAVHKQTKKMEYDDDHHHLQHPQMIIMLTHKSHREDSEREQIIYGLTLPGTATIVAKPNMKLNLMENFFFFVIHVVFKIEINHLENIDE